MQLHFQPHGVGFTTASQQSATAISNAVCLETDTSCRSSLCFFQTCRAGFGYDMRPAAYRGSHGLSPRCVEAHSCFDQRAFPKDWPVLDPKNPEVDEVHAPRYIFPAQWGRWRQVWSLRPLDASAPHWAPLSAERNTRTDTWAHGRLRPEAGISGTVWFTHSVLHSFIVSHVPFCSSTTCGSDGIA